MHFIEVKIPKEIRQHKETIFFGLSARQFICSALAVVIAVAIYLALGDKLGKDNAGWVCMLLAAPVAVAGFFNYNGMNFEQFLWAFIKSEFLLVGDRKFIGENLYFTLSSRKDGAKKHDKNTRRRKQK